MAILEQNIIRLKELTIDWGYSKRNIEPSINEKKKVLPYAYPCDNYINVIMSNSFVRKSLHLVVDRYYKNQIDKIRLNSQKVTEMNYPYLFLIVQECYQSLNVTNYPEIMVTNQLKGINALSVGTDKSPVILLSKKSVACLTDDELKFMIGHELGHILQKNMICHIVKGFLDNLNNSSEVLGPIISDMIDVPLNLWHRCAEYTADRAGLLCCKDINVIKRLFYRINKNYMKKTGMLMEYYELSNIHPVYAKRISELEIYYNHFVAAEIKKNINRGF